MEMPSTQGYRSFPYAVDQDLINDSSDLNLTMQLEKIGIANLQPRQVLVGSYVRHQFRHPAVVRNPDEAPQVEATGSFRVFRNNDYDTGRPNIRVHLRESSERGTHVCDLEHDTIVTGWVVNFSWATEFARVQKDGELDWQMTRDRREFRNKPTDKAPVRRRELFVQCEAMLTSMSRYMIAQFNQFDLTNNWESRPGADDSEKTIAIYQLVTVPLMVAILKPAYYEQQLKKAREGDAEISGLLPGGKELATRAGNLRKEFVMSDRICLPEHYAFYNRIYRSFRFLEKRRKRQTGHIAPEHVLRLYVKWYNALSPLFYAAVEAGKVERRNLREPGDEIVSLY